MCIQARQTGNDPVVALVVKTNFMTLKGGLVRDILFPKPSKFKFYTDSLKFIGILACIAIFSDFFTIPAEIKHNVDTFDIVDNALDIITVTVPPALPAAMTAGTIYSSSRLSKLKINCISPPRINVSGRVKLMVFDKTGTLTEDGLEVSGFRANSFNGVRHYFDELCDSLQGLMNSIKTKESIQGQFLQAMASCHSITRVKSRLIGDPLDVRMFEATEWTLDEEIRQEDVGFVQAYVRPEEN